MPHDFDHEHADVSGGWLRPATFGAMDGLVSNTALIAGVGAVADAHAVVLSGVAGLVAGACSMALGEYTSVTTANEQIDSEVQVEQRAFETHPHAEKAELVAMFQKMGLSRDTAVKATDELHRTKRPRSTSIWCRSSASIPQEKPSAPLAAISSFVMFAIGAVIPLHAVSARVPLAVGGLGCGGIGLLIAGGVAARFTRKPLWLGSLRQLALRGGRDGRHLSGGHVDRQDDLARRADAAV